MALVYVGGKTAPVAASTSTDTTISLTDLSGGAASAPAEGDIVLVGYAIAGSTTGPDPVIVTSDYTEIADISVFDGDCANLSVGWKIQGSTPDTEVVVGPTSNASFSGCVAIHVWRNVDATTPLDATSTTATAANSILVNPPSITTVTDGAEVVAFGTGATRSTLPTEYSSQPGLSNALQDTGNPATSKVAIIGVGSALQSTAGALDLGAWSISPDINQSQSSWAAITVALRPAAITTITGTLAATESGSDAAAISGVVPVGGSLSASESGSDTFAASGVVPIVGALAATEAGQDTAELAGSVPVAGSLAATETGFDVALIAGVVPIVGELAATETGQDSAVFTDSGAQEPVHGSLAATEAGADTAAFAGGVRVTGTVEASESDPDIAALAGTVLITGQLAAQETGQDTAAFTQTLPVPVFRSLVTIPERHHFVRIAERKNFPTIPARQHFVTIRR